MKKVLTILVVLLLLCGCANTEATDSSTSPETTANELLADYSKQISEVEAFLPIDSRVYFEYSEGTTYIRIELFADNSDDFGVNIYKIHQYCVTSLSEKQFEIQVTVFNSANIETWRYSYLSGSDGYGILTYKRGTSEKNTEFNSLVTMRAYFPLLNQYLLEQNIHPDDLVLYHEIDKDIQIYQDAHVDSNTVFAYVANQYDMSPSQLSFFLLEAKHRINSGEVYLDRIPLVYPRSLTYDDSLGIEEIPEIIYTTTGSENGLADNVYYIEGEVVRYETHESSDKTIMNLFVIKNDLGEVIVLDMVDYTLDYGQKHRYSDAAIKVYQEATAHEDFRFPEIGQHVRIYCIYGGFSGLFELPIVYYGITDYSDIG